MPISSSYPGDCEWFLTETKISVNLKSELHINELTHYTGIMNL